MKREFIFWVVLLVNLSISDKLIAQTIFSEHQQDTITSMIGKLQGYWLSNDREIIELADDGIFNSQIYFEQCVILREVGETNEVSFNNCVSISEPILISITETDAPEPDWFVAKELIKKLYIPTNFDVYIIENGEYYGFQYPKELENLFIPIQFLDDELLILVDGRTFNKTD